MKGKKINNDALEMIMRDVLHGMAEFICDSSCAGQLGDMEIIAIESPQGGRRKGACILPFPSRRKTSVVK